MQTGKPTVTKGDSTLALYPFDEHAGETIHNKVISGTNLYIPGRYLVVDQAFLESPRKEFRRNGTQLNDVLINIAGFLPLGFLLCAYFTSVRQVKHGVWAVIALGAIVSFTIEVLQAYLPTRDSGLTDVMTNTLGTALGAGLYRIAASRIVRALTLKWSSHFDVPAAASRR
jgi:VanZ family protein